MFEEFRSGRCLKDGNLFYNAKKPHEVVVSVLGESVRPEVHTHSMLQPAAYTTYVPQSCHQPMLCQRAHRQQPSRLSVENKIDVSGYLESM